MEIKGLPIESRADNARGGRARRLKTLRSLRAYVAAMLRQLEGEEADAHLDRYRVAFQGAKLLADLIEAARQEEGRERFNREMAELRQARERAA